MTGGLHGIIDKITHHSRPTSPVSSSRKSLDSSRHPASTHSTDSGPVHLKCVLFSLTSCDCSTELTHNAPPPARSANGEPESKSEMKKRLKQEEKDKKKQEAAKKAAEKEAAEKAKKAALEDVRPHLLPPPRPRPRGRTRPDPRSLSLPLAQDYSPESYGKLPLNNSSTRSGALSLSLTPARTERAAVADLAPPPLARRHQAHEARRDHARARGPDRLCPCPPPGHSRSGCVAFPLLESEAERASAGTDSSPSSHALAGAKMVFVVLRQQDHTIQGLVVVEPELVSKKMVRWVEGVNDESIVLVEAVVQRAKEPIKSCTIHDVELKVRKVRRRAPSLPFVLVHVRVWC